MKLDKKIMKKLKNSIYSQMTGKDKMNHKSIKTFKETFLRNYLSLLGIMFCVPEEELIGFQDPPTAMYFIQ